MDINTTRSVAGGESGLVPHLTTALTGPFRALENHILDQQSTIESWFRKKWREHPAPFYSSMDIRNAGFKVAPVDTNLFPAGFNNLNTAFEPLCIQAIRLALERFPGNVDRILLVPENHSRNPHYLENVFVLRLLIEKAGFDVRVGCINGETAANSLSGTMQTALGHTLEFAPVRREGNRIVLDDFTPDLLILNNDLSGGIPSVLHGIEQRITPALEMGWSSRLKSRHFSCYSGVAREFAELTNQDPWLVEPISRNCGEVNFIQREGVDCLTHNIDILLRAIQQKYDEYKVNCKPFIIVKADSGTYGMGVMTIHNVEEIAELNRKQRARMSRAKEGQEIRKVIIQEGVYTNETWLTAEAVAEPVVYCIDHQVVGGFYRVHTQRSHNENLNAPGMRFEPLAFADCCISPDKAKQGKNHVNRFYTYGVIARLALLAAALEMDGRP